MPEPAKGPEPVKDKDLWTRVDDYINKTLVDESPALKSAIEDAEAAGLPAISVSPSQGKLLRLLVQVQRARRVLEIGTLAGYSTIWMAGGLVPSTGGKSQLIAIEYEPKHAAIARKNVERAGLGDLVEIRIGKANDVLAQLVSENAQPFDVIFIDADKEGYTDYFQWSLKLSRPGTLIIADNVVRDGAVADPQTKDAMVQGIRRFNEVVAAERRVSATAIQTVGSKGYDGLALILVTG